MENTSKELLQKTEKSKVRFDELTDLISRPEIIADNREWKKLVKERNSLEELAAAHVELETLVSHLEGCQNDLQSESDSEMKALFEAEIEELEKAKKVLKTAKILTYVPFVALALSFVVGFVQGLTGAV